MFTYANYGLIIQSAIEIPEFSLTDQKPSVNIHLDAARASTYLRGSEHPRFDISRSEALLRIPGLGSFIVRDGTDITIIPDPEGDLDLIRRFLIGNILGILLYQRNNLVLHASSVQVNAHTIGLIGDVGKGKSTLAAGLVVGGHGFLADDVAAIDLQSQPPRVIPGYPQLKISIPLAEFLGIHPDQLSLITAQEEKRGLRVEKSYISTPQVLDKLYIIRDAPQLEIKPLSSQEALIELVRYSIPTRWRMTDEPEHFRDCLTLLRSARIYSLSRPGGFHLLPDIVSLIEEHNKANL